jgi:hypothetical protein
LKNVRLSSRKLIFVIWQLRDLQGGGAVKNRQLSQEIYFLISSIDVKTQRKFGSDAQLTVSRLLG